MRLNDTTRAYFEQLAAISPPEQARDLQGAARPRRRADDAQAYLRRALARRVLDAAHVGRADDAQGRCRARTSSRRRPKPRWISARCPARTSTSSTQLMANVIGDPAVKIVPLPQTRPPSPASRAGHGDVSRDGARRQDASIPGATVLPSMSTGASDQAQLRAKGIQSYGIGPASTEADALNYPAHGDVERLAESSLYPFVQYVWQRRDRGRWTQAVTGQQPANPALGLSARKGYAGCQSGQIDSGNRRQPSRGISGGPFASRKIPEAMPTYSCRINGRDVTLHSWDPNQPLLYALRSSLGLTGTRVGCGLGQCGTCTVLLDDQAVRSCIVPTSSVAGHRVTTIEGLGTPDQPDRAAGRVHHRAGGAVRLLHERLRDGHESAAHAYPEPDTGRGENSAGGQPLPLRHLYANSQGGHAGREPMTREAPWPSASREQSHESARLAQDGRRVRRRLHLSAMCRQSADRRRRRAPPGPLEPTGGRSIRNEVDSFLSIHPDGSVTVYTSKVDVGTGMRIAMAQMAAEELGVDTARVTVVDGDTARCPNTGGTGGSTGLTRGGTAVRQAAATARQALLGLAATRLNRPASDLTIVAGEVRPSAGGRGVRIGDLVGGRRLALPVDAKAPLVPPSQVREGWTVPGEARCPCQVHGPLSVHPGFQRSRHAPRPGDPASSRRRHAPLGRREPPSRSCPAFAWCGSKASSRSSRTTSGQR